MSVFVLDSSVALSWCFGNERTPALDALESRLISDSAVVPALWYFEIANVLVLAVRKGRISAAQRDGYFANFLARPIVVDMDSTGAAIQATAKLADKHGLTAYDAAYLELALRRSIPLATLDGDLRRAASSVSIELLGV